MASTLQSEALNFIKLTKDGLQNGDPVVLGAFIALIAIFITTLLVVISRNKNTRRGVLLIGICDSGKTLMYNRLVNDGYADTYTSIKENSGSYKLTGNKSGSLRVIDIPGHERLRLTSLEQFKPLARAIIFIIDSVSFQKDIKDVADLLYTVLTDRVIHANRPPILVACNKQDLTLAKGSKVIQSQLEKELTKVRLTQGAALSSGDNSSIYLGKRGTDFKFVDLRSLKVDFVECSLKGPSGTENEYDLKHVYEWLQHIA